jgi:hypothetical protein
MTARDRYRATVAETLTGWRLGVIPPRLGPELAVTKDALKEIIRLRLLIAYMPLLQGLFRIEARVDVLCNLREDPYAPPPRKDKL